MTLLIDMLFLVIVLHFIFTRDAYGGRELTYDFFECYFILFSFYFLIFLLFSFFS